MLSATVLLAQQAPQGGLHWWEIVLLFVVGPAVVLTAIAVPVLVVSRRRPPPAFPRLAPGTVQANPSSQQGPPGGTGRPTSQVADTPDANPDQAPHSADTPRRPSDDQQ